MSGEVLYGVPQRLLALSALAIFLCAFEIAYRLGRRERSRLDTSGQSQLSTMEAAMLGLLALLLGFSFAMAETRYEQRRGLIVDESTAIGTTWLRSRLAPEPHRAMLDRLMRRYVDARIEFYRTQGITANPASARRASVETERLQRLLWQEASDAAAVDPRAVTTGLLLHSLNEVIDLHEKRLVSLETHVPEPILVLIGFVAAAAFALVGYANGLSGARQMLVTVLSAFVVVAVLTLIVDLDRPIRGHLRIGQQTLLRLRDSMNAQ
jgi:hypothetical protein